MISNVLNKAQGSTSYVHYFHWRKREANMDQPPMSTNQPANGQPDLMMTSKTISALKIIPFSHFWQKHIDLGFKTISCILDGCINIRPTNPPRDTASYRDARRHLKMLLHTTFGFSQLSEFCTHRLSLKLLPTPLAPPSTPSSQSNTTFETLLS